MLVLTSYSLNILINKTSKRLGEAQFRVVPWSIAIGKMLIFVCLTSILLRTHVSMIPCLANDFECLQVDAAKGHDTTFNNKRMGLVELDCQLTKSNSRTLDVDLWGICKAVFNICLQLMALSSHSIFCQECWVVKIVWAGSGKIVRQPGQDNTRVIWITYYDSRSCSLFWYLDITCIFSDHISTRFDVLNATVISIRANSILLKSQPIQCT